MIKGGGEEDRWIYFTRKYKATKLYILTFQKPKLHYFPELFPWNLSQRSRIQAEYLPVSKYMRL